MIERHRKNILDLRETVSRSILLRAGFTSLMILDFIIKNHYKNHRKEVYRNE